MGKTRVYRGVAGSQHRWRGAALIEMTVSLTILFSLVMGGVEFGWYLFSKHVVQSAARDGARAAIVPGATQASATSAISSTMSSSGIQSYSTTFNNASTNATITDVSTVPRGTGIKVTITVAFGTLNVRPLGVIPANKSLIGVTTMMKE